MSVYRRPGLVRGASEGAGLGNKFLANIREVSVIVQLLRCFDDTDDTIIEHVDGTIDPVRCSKILIAVKFVCVVYNCLIFHPGISRQLKRR